MCDYLYKCMIIYIYTAINRHLPGQGQGDAPTIPKGFVILVGKYRACVDRSDNEPGPIRTKPN